MRIEDGKGTGSEASVTDDNRLNVSANSNPREFYISRDDGEAYHFTSTFNATTGAIVISVRNTSQTKNLYIGEVICCGETNCTWDVYLNNGVDTGTTLTSAVNLNATSSNTPSVDALGNAAVTLGTANTATGLVTILKSSAFTTVRSDMNDAVVLGRNDSINIGLTGNGTVAVTIDGHFE